MPGSPESSTTWPSPSLARSQRSSSSASSCSRPTSGVRPGRVQRLEAALGRALAERRAQARTGSAKPLSDRRRRGRASSNRPPRSRRVPSAMTTAPGSASACSRAARFGVSPTTASLARRALADQVADHDQPGRDPDPGGERARPSGAASRPRPRRRRARRGPPARPSSSCARGPAEVGQHAVAHELGDVALEARDLAGDGVLVGAERARASPRGRAGRRARSSRPGRRTSP